MAITGIASQHQDERVVAEELVADGDITAGDDVIVGDDAIVGGDLQVSGNFSVGVQAIPHNFTITLAASATTDGMDISIKAVTAAGVAIGGVHTFDFYMSETNTGTGITADTYSGDLTKVAGSILVALVAKKMWRVTTDPAGEFAGVLVDSANPVDQYVCVIHPLSGNPVVSVASGTKWQGAA